MPASDHVTINELRSVIALSDLPEEHLRWLLEHGTYAEYPDEHVMVRSGEPIENMWLLIEGRIRFHFEVKGGSTFEYIFANEPITGGVGGVMPYSRLKTSPGMGVASGHVRAVLLHKKHFKELESLNPAFIQKLIAYMTDRARAFATRQMQEEKVSALGKLAAGIAHEINNPASAISRFTDELVRRLMLNYELTEKLLEIGVNSKFIGTLRAMIESRNEAPDKPRTLSMRERIEKEDEITAWLEENGFSDYFHVSETFADQGISREDFESIRSSFGDKAFGPVLLWLENLVSSQRTIRDLAEAARRISRLVGAIKSHVHMDRTGGVQPTELHQDIENTLTLLGHKMRNKNITVVRDFDESIRTMDAYVSELNQVWTNLIDNAIDALPKNGTITVRTKVNARDVHVTVCDDGPGIPKDIQSRIFDPFFTTKKVGEGTGIGLDLVKRIIAHHHGEIRVFSEPGHTEFFICLPMKQPVPEQSTGT